MGYNTDFRGKLFYKNEPKKEELKLLKTFMREDCRDHPEWGNTNLTWIDLDCDEEGVFWDGGEKTYDLPEKINLITYNMRKKFPEFELTGELLAQGEDIEDRWKLIMHNGVAYKEYLSDNILDLSWMWHCAEKSENILKVKGEIDDPAIVELIERASKVGFRYALAILNELRIISLKDLDRKPNDLDQEMWDSKFSSKLV